MKKYIQHQRSLPRLLLVALMFGFGVIAAAAQEKLRIMAPGIPEGGYASTARALQQALVSGGLAREVAVYYLPGEGGVAGLIRFVQEARGDSTHLMITGHTTVGSILLNRTPLSLDDVTPIARLTSDISALAVRADSPIKDARQLAAMLKAEPSKVAWAAGSVGGAGHTTVVMFALANQVDPARLNFSAYGGEKTVEAIVSGKVTVGVLSGYGTYEKEIAAGRLRLIGFTSAHRKPGIDCPTLTEQGIDLVFENWRGVVAAPGLTAEQRQVLAGTVDQMVKSKAWLEIVKQKGWDDAYLGGEAFASFLKAEKLRIERAYRATGILK